MNIIFDMDGLMFDTESVFVKAFDYAGDKMGIGKAGYMVQKTLGMSIVASFEIWKAEFKEAYNEEQLRSYTKEFLTSYYEKNKVPVKKGLYELLDFLKRNEYRMAVASSSPQWEVKKHLADANIRDYFEVVVCGDMVKASKPNPEIYEKVCQLLGVTPETCFALEDSKNGLLSAHRAGCKAIMIPDLWQPDDEIKQIIFGKYDDLLQVKEAIKAKQMEEQC